jgi:hypothetical protein
VLSRWCKELCKAKLSKRTRKVSSQRPKFRDQTILHKVSNRNIHTPILSLSSDLKEPPKRHKLQVSLQTGNRVKHHTSLFDLLKVSPQHSRTRQSALNNMRSRLKHHDYLSNSRPQPRGKLRARCRVHPTLALVPRLRVVFHKHNTTRANPPRI